MDERHRGRHARDRGQWVSPDQTALLETLDQLGLATYDRYREGSSVYIDQHGSRTEYTGDIFPLPEATRPRSSGSWPSWTSTSRRSTRRGPGRRRTPRRSTRSPSASGSGGSATTGRDRERRALHRRRDVDEARAHVLRPAGPAHGGLRRGASRTSSTPTSSSTSASSAGMQQVSERLAARLGDDVHLNAPVRTLRWDDEGVGRDRRRRRRGPSAAGPRGRPAAPVLADLLRAARCPDGAASTQSQHLSMGFVIKVHAVYDRPFWRGRGAVRHRVQPVRARARGVRQLDARLGSRARSSGSSPTSTRTTSSRCRRRNARPACSTRSRTTTVTRRAARSSTYESDWGTEEWTRGAYAASFDLGGLVRYGADQRAAVGPLRFASSDLAGTGTSTWTGRCGWARSGPPRSSPHCRSRVVQ